MFGALLLLGAGAGLSAYSSYKEAKAGNAAAEYNAQMMERNAEISEMQARDSLKRGKESVKTHNMNVARFMGSQRAAFGASGVVVDEGSAFDVMVDTAYLGEKDAVTIERNAKREALGYMQQGEGFESQAELSRMRKRDPGEAAGMSLLTSATNTGGSYLLGKA